MKNLTVIGKYLYVIPFIIFGIMHFMNGSAMAGYIPSFIPGGIFWVYLTGLGLILAPIAVFINKYAKLAMLLLGIMLLVFVLTIHLPGVLNSQTMGMYLPNFLKDLALAGAAFFFYGHFDK
ncbi:MAG: DoxX family protein [Ignavibacteria bacterium RBG_13_36_8]|nr:MAG: DoxX family protein [Ignavibacteria bacterium RBG_13_36_8]